MLEKSTKKTEKKPRCMAENRVLRKLSRTALALYERQCDIKRFSKMALADLDNILGMDKLFEDGMVVDPFEDAKFEKLAENSRLLRDLGFKDF